VPDAAPGPRPRARPWRHVAALVAPLWVPATVVVGAIHALSWAGAAEQAELWREEGPGALLRVYLGHPLAFGLMLPVALPMGVALAAPGVLLGAPVYVLALRAGWTRLWHFTLIAAVVCVAAAWPMGLLDAAPGLVPFGPRLARGAASFALLGAATGAVMWVHACAPPAVDRTLAIGGLLLAALAPPAACAVVVFALPRRWIRPGGLAKRLALTSALAVAAAALVAGRRLPDPMLLRGFVPAFLAWAVGGALLLRLLLMVRDRLSGPPGAAAPIGPHTPGSGT
jgi:hypothetical protein